MDVEDRLRYLSLVYGFRYHLELNPVGMYYNLSIKDTDGNGFWTFPADEKAAEFVSKIVHEFYK